jgi:branched-subunit amino acid transport protein
MRPDSLGSFEIALLIGGMALVTLLTRAFFVFLGARVQVPELVLRAIRYAPLAAIVGIVAPELLLPPGAIEISQMDWKSPQSLGWISRLCSLFLDSSDATNPYFGYDRV